MTHNKITVNFLRSLRKLTVILFRKLTVIDEKIDGN